MSKVRLRKLDAKRIPEHRVLLLVGKRGSGKTVLLLDLLYSMRDRFDIGIMCSPTQSTVESFERIMPSSLIYNDYDAAAIGRMIDMQRARQRSGKPLKRVFIVLDDCAYDRNMFNSKGVHMRQIFYNGRHLGITLLLCMQAAIDGMPPAMRGNVDLLFTCRDMILTNQERLHKHYFGQIASFDAFQKIFTECTKDHEVLVSDSTGKGSDDPTSSLFWYKARLPLPPFRLCAPWVWRLHQQFRVIPGQEEPAAVDLSKGVESIEKSHNTT